MAGYPFVGREGVLAELRARLEDARAGHGGLVVLTGVAGVGKTRTAEETAARADGFRTLWTWCPPGASARPFRPWSRILRELVADDVRCGRLVRASPSLRALAAGAPDEDLRGADPEAARLRLAGDVADVLRTVAARTPLLLVLDDVHAADPSSLRLLLEAADPTRTARVLLLATARDDEAAWHDRAWAHAELLGRGDSLPLGPLRERDVADLMTAATGTKPTSDAVRGLMRQTGGDAFYVTEMLRYAGGTGTAAPAPSGGGTRTDGDEEPGPGSGRSPRAGARLAGLSRAARRVLDVAAALGTGFRVDVVAEATSTSLDEVRALLDEGARAGVLAGVRAGAGAFRHDLLGAFRHDLLRDAVYARLSPGARAALHRRLAEVLAGSARRGRDVGPGEVAYHLLLAGPECARDAARYAREAAERAAALLAHEDAARWYERAAATTDDTTELAELHLGLGAARLGTGDRADARTAFLRAAGLARTAGRPDLLAQAALGLGTGPVGFDADLVDHAQIDLLTEARAALGTDPARAALCAATTARLSVATSLVESEQHRVDLAEEAVRTARAAEDPAALGPALAALCDARPGPDHCLSRLAWAGEIVAAARRLPDPALELLGRRLRLVALLETGDITGADAEAVAYEATVRPLHRPLYAWYVPLWRGARALMEGRFADCRTALADAEAIGGRAGTDHAALPVSTLRWCLLAESGDLAGLERMLATMPPLDRNPGLWPQVTLALVAAQLGRLDEAARRLTAVAPRLGDAPRGGEWLPMLAQAAETIGLIGAHDAAAGLYAGLAPYADLLAVEGIGAAVRGPVHRHLALLAQSLGNVATARRHGDAALAAARRLGALGWVDRLEREREGIRQQPFRPPRTF